MKRPEFITFLLIWQIIESVGLFFAIPFAFIFGVLLTGDSYKTFDFVASNIIPILAGLLLIKIVLTIASFKNKRWAAIVNFVQNGILLLLFIAIAIAAYFQSVSLGMGYYFVILLFASLTVGFYFSFNHPYFKQQRRPDKDSLNQ